MNGQTNIRQQEPWSRREELPRIKTLDAILACVAVLLSSVAILLCGNENASFLTLLGLTAFGVIGMRRGKDLLLLLLEVVMEKISPCKETTYCEYKNDCHNPKRTLVWTKSLLTEEVETFSHSDAAYHTLFALRNDESHKRAL